MGKINCGDANYPFVATSLEPIRWNVKEITYETKDGKQVPKTVIFKMGSVEVFRHEITNDSSGNPTKIEVK